jgi:hypothetical protein
MVANSIRDHDPNMERFLYDRKAAAEAVSLSIRSIDYFLSQGEFETRRIGRKVLITASSLKKFASQNHYGPVDGREDSEEQEQQRAA